MAFRAATKPAAATTFKHTPAQVAKVGGCSRRRVVSVHADRDDFRATGFVAEDNSGRANIFPTKQQAYLKSSTADAAAKQGLGGLQGGLLVGFAIGAVALVTLVGAKAPGPETLQSVQVSSASESESLANIAQRIQRSL